MKTISIKPPGGLENILITEQADPTPKAGEILVQWHATSLNYHDFLVGMGMIPVADGRVPMSDGAGEILAIGEGVTQWKIGDKVMSMFFPHCIEGKPTFAKTRGISGESIDRYFVEKSCVSATAVTAIPKGYTYAEAATLPCAAAQPAAYPRRWSPGRSREPPPCSRSPALR